MLRDYHVLHLILLKRCIYLKGNHSHFNSNSKTKNSPFRFCFSNWITLLINSSQINKNILIPAGTQANLLSKDNNILIRTMKYHLQSRHSKITLWSSKIYLFLLWNSNNTKLKIHMLPKQTGIPKSHIHNLAHHHNTLCNSNNKIYIPCNLSSSIQIPLLIKKYLILLNPTFS